MPAAPPRRRSDLVLHLAAESHVDRSIAGPGPYRSNVNGTFHLLQAVLSHWEALPEPRRPRSVSITSAPMRYSGRWGRRGFSETTPYDPRSPTPQARQPAITWYGPGITPMGCRWCSLIAVTTSGLGSIQKNSYR